MNSNKLYEVPQRGVKLSDFWFYHTMDIPGHGTINGYWDLHPFSTYVAEW
jgi:hypothetical protein